MTTAAILACFTLSAVGLAALYCQALLRHVTVRRHLHDACRAMLRGRRAPRPVLSPLPVDGARIAELESKLGIAQEPPP